MVALKGWIIINGSLKTESFLEMADVYKAAAEEEGVTLEVVFNNELLIGIQEGKLFLKGEQVIVRPEFILFLDKDLHLAKQLEALGFRVFNSASVIEKCDNKALTFQVLAGEEIPMPKTLIAPLVYEGMLEEGGEYIDQIEKHLGYPHIIKESFGSFGEQVYLIHNREELKARRKQLINKPHLYQEFISSSNGKDVRVYVVGGEVVASMLRSSDNDFRANVAIGGKAIQYMPPERFTQLAVKICTVLQADFAGIDLLFGEDGNPILCEVNSNAHIKAIMTCTGVNIAQKIIQYIKKEVIKS